MQTNTESRVALVTGSGKGVGAGIVRVFTSKGIKCCINCNTNKAMAEELLAEITAAGGEAFLYQADINDPAQLKGMIDAIIERYGRLDILVNNAALQRNKGVKDYDYDDFKLLWNVNIGGYVHAVQACLPYLRKSPQPSIVNVSSIHGKRPLGIDAGYSMSKGAIRMFTRELSVELLKEKIRVNTIDLGACKIEFKTGKPGYKGVHSLETRGNIDEYFHDVMVYPTDVGELAYFLCSDEAKAINGAGIRLDKSLALM